MNPSLSLHGWETEFSSEFLSFPTEEANLNIVTKTKACPCSSGELFVTKTPVVHVGNMSNMATAAAPLVRPSFHHDDGKERYDHTETKVEATSMSSTENDQVTDCRNSSPSSRPRRTILQTLKTNGQKSSKNFNIVSFSDEQNSSLRVCRGDSLVAREEELSSISSPPGAYKTIQSAGESDQEESCNCGALWKLTREGLLEGERNIRQTVYLVLWAQQYYCSAANLEDIIAQLYRQATYRCRQEAMEAGHRHSAICVQPDEEVPVNWISIRNRLRSVICTV